jgi:hypothetical protein
MGILDLGFWILDFEFEINSLRGRTCPDARFEIRDAKIEIQDSKSEVKI